MNVPCHSPSSFHWARGFQTTQAPREGPGPQMCPQRSGLSTGFLLGSLPRHALPLMLTFTKCLYFSLCQEDHASSQCSPSPGSRGHTLDAARGRSRRSCPASASTASSPSALSAPPPPPILDAHNERPACCLTSVYFSLLAAPFFPDFK